MIFVFARPVLFTVTLRRRPQRDVGTAAARTRSREREGLRQAQSQRTIAVVATIATLLVTGYYVIGAITTSANATNQAGDEPSTPSVSPEQRRHMAGLVAPAIMRFELAWAERDQTGLQALGGKEFVEQRWPKVQKILRKRGWDVEFPTIALDRTLDKPSPTEKTEKTEKEARFDVDPKDQLKTHWVFDEDRWKLRRIVYSRTR